MKASALAISLILMLVPLAGCAGSDGEVNIDLTTEEIQELIDDNIDDFLNNTTVTVNQENHNNNTTNSQTIVNHNNYTTIESPSSLKSKSGSMAGVESSNNFVSGLSLLVREDSFFRTGSSVSHDINGANICIGIGTILEGELVQWFSEHDASFTSVPVSDAAEATAKFIDGSCDAMAFSSSEEVQQKKVQLDTDGSMGGVDIWVASLDAGVLGELSEVGSSISILVDQSSDEAIIGLRYAFLQVELSGTCNANATDCENFTIAISPTKIASVSTCSHGTPFHFEAYNLMDADKGVYSYWGDSPWHAMFGGQGLNCTHSLNFEINMMVDGINLFSSQAGFDRDSHTLSWGDWAYSIVWETRSIEQVN
jgi:hypothetical protein